MTANDSAIMVEALIQQARAAGASDEDLAEKLQDAADALRDDNISMFACVESVTHPVPW